MTQQNADDHLGILLLQMAQDAKHDGDVATSDMLRDAALRYFDEAGRLTRRLGDFESRLDEAQGPHGRKAA
ncbi:MAG TPA: hypothetical protein VH684_17085 [Xanthobacteraceae bacterium]|jgi:hypothetical protein